MRDRKPTGASHPKTPTTRARPSTKAKPHGARPTALVRAEHGAAPIRLSGAQQRVFDEALRRGEDLSSEVETKVSEYGRWLLASVFDNDVSAALDAKTKNPIWLELVRRSGGPTLRVGRRMLYVALQIAAYDKRIPDEAWRRLDAGRKEILLPLDEPRRLREAADHVSKFRLTQAKTREYVGSLLADGGKSQQVRITAPLLVRRITALRESLDGAVVLRRVKALQAALEPAERNDIASEIDKLREVLSSIAREIRGR